MAGWRWSILASALLAALAAILTTGVSRGSVYGRYVAVQALFERRLAALDGSLNGLRPTPGGVLDGVAYVGGHYYLTEPPLLLWAASPLYAIGNLVGLALPGVGWSAALTALVGPLLVFATLAGVANLARQHGLRDRVSAAIVLAVGLGLPMLPAAAVGSPWLLAAALSVWLLAGAAWQGWRTGFAHGVIAGAMMAAYPALAPAALVGLLARRVGILPRLVGCLVPVAAVSAWQWLLFDRPWRLASQFRLESPTVADSVPAIGIALLLVGIGTVMHRRGLRALWPVVLTAGLAAIGLIATAEGPNALRVVGLAGTLALGLALVVSGIPATMTLRRIGAIGVTGVATAAVSWPSAVQASGDVLLPFGIAQRATMGLALIASAALCLVLVRSPRSRVATAVVGCLLTLVGLGVVALPVSASASVSLVPPFSAPATTGGPPLVLWRVTSGARLDGNRLLLPTSDASADSPVVAARPGERYCAVVDGMIGSVILQWEDDAKRVLAQHGGNASRERLCFAAPAGATGVRLRLIGGPSPAVVASATLFADGARVAPLPDYAVAALAFTFDWESAMGGLVHSKGGSGGYEAEGGGPAREEGGDPLAIAVERGARMRTGATTLADVFRTHAIRGTFYSNGYNLLTGNVDRRTFAGDPTYRWANRANGWASNYWINHRWYGDDPYGTEASHPEWYSGSIARQLAAEGHEIESHTFGHLYARGATPDELTVDQREWNDAAARLGLRAARSFAFPWRSSNSIRQPHFERLVATGITSLTRVYRLRPGYEYELDEALDMPGLTVYPDHLLLSTPASGQEARRAIDEVLMRRGFQSLWSHPEEVVEATQVEVWRDVVDYAAAARTRGLWIAPLGEIIERVRAGRLVDVVTLREPGATHVWLNNTGPTPIDGVVVELDGMPTQHTAGVTDSARAGSVRVPRLEAGEGRGWTLSSDVVEP